jgi:hypothetical protein
MSKLTGIIVSVIGLILSTTGLIMELINDKELWYVTIMSVLCGFFIVMIAIFLTRMKK